MKSPSFKSPRKKPAYYDVIKRAPKSRDSAEFTLKFPDADTRIDPYADLTLEGDETSFFEKRKIPVYSNLGAAGAVGFNPYSLLHQNVSFSFLKEIPLKIIAVALCLTLILPLFIFGVLKINEYLYVKALLDQAKLANNGGKYQAALTILDLTQAKWATSDIKQEIDLETQKGRAALAQQTQATAASAVGGQESEAQKKEKLTKALNKASIYLSSTASALRAEADNLYQECLKNWNKLKTFFPGSTYNDYRDGCTENKDNYLKNITDDEKRFKYYKLKAEYLLKKIETGGFTDADLALYLEITSNIN